MHSLQSINDFQLLNNGDIKFSKFTDGTSCQLNEFRCANGKRCIDETKRCDHWNDCGDDDLSDEEKCEFPPCSAGHFRCTNAICIPIKWLCDGHSDCNDAIDEANCSKIVFIGLSICMDLSRFF